MTLQECYGALHGNYDDARSRLMTDRLIEKFMLKFLDDTSMDLLKESVEQGNIPESFRAAHTLKGVAANLAFTELMETSSELTEQLRSCTVPADEELYRKVTDAYEVTVKAITAYKNEMNS